MKENITVAEQVTDIITTVCGWCGIFMGTKPGHCSAGQVSHSICPACLERKL